jgi:hypothetical protein
LRLHGSSKSTEKSERTHKRDEKIERGGKNLEREALDESERERKREEGRQRERKREKRETERKTERKRGTHTHRKAEERERVGLLLLRRKINSWHMCMRVRAKLCRYLYVCEKESSTEN